MKYLFFIFLFINSISMAQISSPKFENDTLYTSSGYKMYKGQILQFGKASRANGKFRFINIKNDFPDSKLFNKAIVIKKLKNFSISSLGNAYIDIVVTYIYSDSSKSEIDIHMAFDNAIDGYQEFPSELIVPEEYKNKHSKNVSEEIERLFKLYKDGALTKEEFENQKKKLLNN